MKRMLSLALCALFLVALLPVSSALAAEDTLEGEYVLDEIIIKFHDPSRFPDKEKQYYNEVAKVLEDGLTQIDDLTYVVKSTDFEKNPNATLNRFKNSAFIDYVEPNYIAKIDMIPNDPDFKTYQKSVATRRNLESMWDITTGTPTIVAVLDTGVYAGHSEFDGRVMNGYDFVSNTPGGKEDTHGHGTMVAGAIAARGNNASGVAGINWEARILPVKVLGPTGTGTASNIAKGIMWAADNGAKIINLSLGSTSDSLTMKNAVDYAASKGCILVAAAGNTGKSTMEYPAKYDKVIGVGAETGTGLRNAVSCYGQGLDIMALGSFRTTTKAGSTATAAGTSFSAPQVAAALSLALEYYPNLDTNSAKELVAAAAVDMATPGWDVETGYGYIDFLKFIETAQSMGSYDAPADTEPPVLTLYGEAYMELEEGEAYDEPGYLAEDNEDGDITDSVIVDGKVSTAFEGRYTLTYTVSDKAGNSAEETRTVVVNPAPVPEAATPPAPTAPSIAKVGSNPIILHIGGSSYIEQGATAYDELDGDISHLVQTDGDVDTSREGTYEIVYTVTNSAGLEASVTREVRVIGPTEVPASRTPYHFSDQGKKGASFSHVVEADQDGIMTLEVPSVKKTSITVTITADDGRTVFSESFSGNATRDFWVSAGRYTVDMSIDSANGNSMINYSLLMPEAIEFIFLEEEVPLGDFPGATGDNTNVLILMGTLGFIAITLVLFAVNRRRQQF